MKMNKKEPTRYSMSTGLPVDKDAEVKHYSMNEGGAEKSFLKFIEDQKESRKKYQERLEKIKKENKDSG